MSTSEPLATPEMPTGPMPIESHSMTYASRPWILGLSIALVAALLAWVGGESGLFTFKPGIGTYNMMGVTVTSETPETRLASEVQTSAVTYGVFGALLGLGLGLTGGMSIGRLKSAIVAAVLGMLVGGVMGFLASRLILPAYSRWSFDARGEALPSLAMHCGLWLPLTAAAGMVYGLGRRGWKHAGGLFGGMAGGLLGTIVYEVLGAFALPMSDTSDPVSGTSLARLVAFLAIALFSTAGAIYAMPTSKAIGVKGIPPVALMDS